MSERDQDTQPDEDDDEIEVRGQIAYMRLLGFGIVADRLARRYGVEEDDDDDDREHDYTTGRAKWDSGGDV